jgi:hypothetical protein
MRDCRQQLAGSRYRYPLYHEGRQSDDALFRRLYPLGKDGKYQVGRGQLGRLQKLGIDPQHLDTISDEDKNRLVRLDIDPDQIFWMRGIDTNDRFLRGITIGQGPQEIDAERKTGFYITVASEIMAVLALATSLEDMRRRLGEMVVALSRKGEPVTAEDLALPGIDRAHVRCYQTQSDAQPWKAHRSLCMPSVCQYRPRQ